MFTVVKLFDRELKFLRAFANPGFRLPTSGHSSKPCHKRQEPDGHTRRSDVH